MLRELIRENKIKRKKIKTPSIDNRKTSQQVINKQKKTIVAHIEVI